MRLGNYTFTPKLIPSVAVILLLPLFISLGFWQLDRADEKSRLADEVQNSLAKAPLALETGIKDEAEYRYRRVEVYGVFESSRVYLLDNAIWQGKPGYLVLMPFHYAGGKASVLVNRGWLPVGATRSELPPVTTPAESLSVTGILSAPPGKLLELDATAKMDATATSWPQVIQQVDMQQIGQQLGYTIAPLILQIDPGHPAAFAQGWKAFVDGPQKHISYAVQWFSFAGIMLLLYVVLNSRRIDIKRNEENVT